MNRREAVLAQLNREVADLRKKLEQETDGRRRGSIETQILNRHKKIKNWTK